MFSFASDYTQGAHPAILERLSSINLEQQPGYGEDPICDSAKEKIRAACHCPQAEIFFLVGGTQANATIIGGMLQNYQGVIAAATGHIACHEAGAVEAGGHKVITLPQENGKMKAADLEAYLKAFYADGTYTHMVIPGMVYLSFPTEYGTLYTLEELTAISHVCREYDLKLFVDGARMGYGLMSPANNVTLEDLARLCDVFYIGGTKVGALFGEAVVFPKKAPAYFFTTVKQKGALLAKGWLLGVQFDTLFTDDLYFSISKNAVDLAFKLRDGFKAKGYSFYMDSPTNQQFVILENSKMKELEEKVTFSIWEPLDQDHTVVRFATSWATTDQQVEDLLAMI